jgi:hypothetical protein
LLPLPRESNETKFDAWDQRSLLFPVLNDDPAGCFVEAAVNCPAVATGVCEFIMIGGESGVRLLALTGADVKLSSPSKSNKSLLLADAGRAAACLELAVGVVKVFVLLTGAALWKSSKSSSQNAMDIIGLDNELV